MLRELPSHTYAQSTICPHARTAARALYHTNYAINTKVYSSALAAHVQLFSRARCPALGVHAREVRLGWEWMGGFGQHIRPVRQICAACCTNRCDCGFLISMRILRPSRVCVRRERHPRPRRVCLAPARPPQLLRAPVFGLVFYSAHSCAHHLWPANIECATAGTHFIANCGSAARLRRLWVWVYVSVCASANQLSLPPWLKSLPECQPASQTAAATATAKETHAKLITFYCAWSLFTQIDEQRK